MADDGRLHVVIDGDASELQKALRDVTGSFDSTRESAEGLGGTIDGLKGKVAAFFSVAAAKSFIQKVYETRSYFQDIESSMKVFLGDAEKAADFTQKLKDYAYYNMFEFADLAQASQQLIAYGNKAEDVIGIIDKLSNIATATKVPLMEMVGLYNRAKNLGGIDSKTLSSWAAKGLVLTDVLKEMGEEVDATSISFDQLNRALDKVTGEGGMFHGLMEEMMPNLSSSWGQLQDELSSMFNEIGEAMQTPMHDAIDLASSLVGNYKKIAETVAGLVLSFGAYKAALVTLNALKTASIALSKGWTVAEMARFKAMALAEKAQKALNATMLKNHYTLAAAGVAALAFGLYKLATAEGAAEKAQRLHAESMEEMSGRYDEAAEAAKKYIGIIQDADAQAGQRALAYDKLKELVPELTNLYSQEELAVVGLTKAYGDLQKIQDIQKEAELKKAWEDASAEVKRYQDLYDKSVQGGSNYWFSANRAQRLLEQAETASRLAFDAYVRKSRENAIAYVPDQNAKEADGSLAKRDKAYWEAVKKEAQAALDAMSYEELKSREAAKLKSKIAEAGRKIEGYSVSAGEGGKTDGGSKAFDTALASARRSAAAAEVAAIEDEGARTLAALRLKHRNEIEELERQKAELESQAAEAGTSLSTDLFDKMIADTAKRQAREYRQTFEKYALKDIQKIDNPATSGGKGLVGFDNLNETKRTLEEIAAQYSLIFASADNLSRNQLKEAIRLTTEEIKNAAPGTQEYIALLERLRSQLETQISNKGWGFSKIADAFRNLPRAVREYNAALDNNDEGAASKAEGEIQAYVQAVKDGMRQMSSAFSELGSALEKFEGTLGEIGGLLSGLASNTDNIITAFTSKNKGEIISSVISSAAQYVSMIGDQLAENKRIEEEWNATIRETAHQLEMLSLESLDYSQSNLFGVENPYKRAIDGARQYSEAVGLINSKVSELEDGLVQVGTKKVTNWKNVGQGAALGAGIGAGVGSFIPAIGNVIGGVIGTVVGALGGLLGGRKKVAVYESLLDHYGSILDKSEGAGPFDLNPEIIADYKKLDDATKQLVDNWDEIKQKAEEAQQQMKENFSDLAGEIGDQLSDALVDAFSNGDLYSAIDDFHGKMTSVIEDILEQLVFSATFGKMFDELEQRFNDSFEEGGDQDITDDLVWMEREYQKRLGDYESAMNQVKESLKNSGYDAWSASDSESESLRGISKSIASASEEQITGLAAGINTQNFYMSFMPVISQNVEAILAAVKDAVSGGGTQNDGASAQGNRGLILGSISRIDENTSEVRRLLKSVITPKSASTNTHSVGVNNPK